MGERNFNSHQIWDLDKIVQHTPNYRSCMFSKMCCAPMRPTSFIF